LNTPVVFIVFRRPELTRRTFAAIRAARPSRLYVVADGPRRERPEEAGLCVEVRRLVEDGVDWPCSMTRIYAAENLGCARRVATGLDEVFAREEEAIVLEDDCLAGPGFFPFCEELLSRFRNDPDVAQIAGCCYQPDAEAEPETSYHFSIYPHCWGWATWRRAWRLYDHELRDFSRAGVDAWARRQRIPAAERRYWRFVLGEVRAGRLDSWACRWTHAVFMQGLLCVNANRNLVSNLGFGEESTHTGDVAHPMAARPARALSFPLKHAATRVPDRRADRYTGRLMFSYPGWWVRAWRRLWREVARSAGGGSR
jgi:hypothetical protein